MIRPLSLALGLALASAPLAAAECHYFWTTDCFEIRNAQTRDISHHVLLSEQRFRVSRQDEQCPVAVDNQLSIDQRGQALKAFNKQLKRLPGCRQLDSLAPRVFDTEAEAMAEWQRLSAPRNFKELHLIRRLR